MTFARTQTLDRLRGFAAALETAGEKPQEKAAIHALRVASRRFGQCLLTFAAVLDEKGSRKIRSRIGKLMDRCGAVRNRDITLALLEDARIGGRSKIVGEVRNQRREAELDLAKHLKRWQERNVLATWPERLFPAEDAEFTPDLAALTADLFARGRAASRPGSSYDEMHQFRLAAKRYRYTVELFKPLYAESAIDNILGGMRSLQNRLGAMNDCVTALDLVKGHKKAEAAMQKLLRRRERAFRSHWKKQFGNKRLNEWTSTFSAMAKPTPAAPALRKPPATLRHAASETSAA